MAKSKQQKNFWLNEKTISEIEEYAEKNKLAGASAAIEIAWNSFMQHDGNTNRVIADTIIDAIDKKYGNQLTGVRLASRQAEFNSSAIIEILNTFAVKQNFDKYISTASYSSPVIHGAIEGTKERLAKMRQKADWRKNGKE